MQRQIINANYQPLSDMFNVDIINPPKNMQGIHLKRVGMKKVDLSESNLMYAEFDQVNLTKAQLEKSNMRKTDLNRVNFRSANLKGVDLSDSFIFNCNFQKADLTGANLSKSQIVNCNFNHSNCTGVDFTSIRTENLNLFSTILNDSKLQSASDYMRQFERVAQGYIVYKVMDVNYKPNPNWKIEPWSFITETVNPDRTDPCACGINFGTLQHCLFYGRTEIWKCLIHWEDAADIVIPYDSLESGRCGRLQLLELVKEVK